MSPLHEGSVSDTSCSAGLGTQTRLDLNTHRHKHKHKHWIRNGGSMSACQHTHSRTSVNTQRYKAQICFAKITIKNEGVFGSKASTYDYFHRRLICLSSRLIYWLLALWNDTRVSHLRCWNDRYFGRFACKLVIKIDAESFYCPSPKWSTTKHFKSSFYWHLLGSGEARLFQIKQWRLLKFVFWGCD